MIKEVRFGVEDGGRDIVATLEEDGILISDGYYSFRFTIDELLTMYLAFRSAE